MLCAALLPPPCPRRVLIFTPSHSPPPSPFPRSSLRLRTIRQKRRCVSSLGFHCLKLINRFLPIQPSHHLPAQKPLLPPELVLVISKKHIRAERLRDKKRTAFLAKCSLVSHAFRELVQPLLFANLDLRPDDFLERKPVVRALQEDGCAAFVVQLHVAAEKEGRRVSRGDLSRLLHECQRLQRLSLNLNLGHPKFLAGCLPMWTNLRRLWIRQSTLDGDLFLTLRHLRELSACTILFSTSVRQGPPPPFHLGSVDLVYPESRLDYDFLLSSS